MRLHFNAQPQLPDLTGLPQWVQITVVLLLAVGWVGTQWARRRPSQLDPGEEEDASTTRPLPPEGVASAVAGQTDHQSTAVIMQALQLLHQEAEESRGGREEADRWRKRAEELEQQLTDCLKRAESPEGWSEP